MLNFKVGDLIYIRLAYPLFIWELCTLKSALSCTDSHDGGFTLEENRPYYGIYLDSGYKQVFYIIINNKCYVTWPCSISPEDVFNKVEI